MTELAEIIARFLTGNEVGPYSTATIVNLGPLDMIFISGHIAPEKKNSRFEEEVKAMLAKFQVTIDSLGCIMENLAHVRIFVSADTNFVDAYRIINELYGAMFSDGNFPARAAIEAKNLPAGARVEIEGIAFRLTK